MVRAGARSRGQLLARCALSYLRAGYTLKAKDSRGSLASPCGEEAPLVGGGRPSLEVLSEQPWEVCGPLPG